MLIPQAIVQEGNIGGLFDAYAYLREEQSSNTDGGSSATASRQTRTLNTEVDDADGIVSISGNEFTLQTGSYWIEAHAPSYGAGRHKIILRNVTDSSDALIGDSSYSGTSADNIQTRATIRGLLQLDSAKAFRIEHYTQTAVATIGLGVASNAGVSEIYTEVEIWRFGSISSGGSSVVVDNTQVANLFNYMFFK